MLEMLHRWYADNAHKVWSAEEMPSEAELIRFSKGLLPRDQARGAARKRRENAKACMEGEQQQVCA